MEQQDVRAEPPATGPLGNWPQVFSQMLLEILPFSPQRELRILLLQVGGSQLANTLASRYPHAQLIEGCVEFSSTDSLSQPDLVGSVRQPVDIRRHLKRGSFDLIIPNLLLFRLPRQERRRVFGDISRVLEPGGWLLGCDLVRAENQMAEKRSRQLQLKRWQSLGASESELSTLLQYWFPESREPLSEQLASLYQAGLMDATCWYQQLGFAIYSACKPLT